LAAAPVAHRRDVRAADRGGLAGTLAPAFGYLPAIGGHAFSLDPWRELVAWPGFASSVRLTLVTGFAATLLSAFLAFGFCAWAAGGRGDRAPPRGSRRSSRRRTRRSRSASRS
jgi:ABC-type phosphate/phosphonate transport system permease subunit